MSNLIESGFRVPVLFGGRMKSKDGEIWSPQVGEKPTLKLNANAPLNQTQTRSWFFDPVAWSWSVRRWECKKKAIGAFPATGFHPKLGFVATGGDKKRKGQKTALLSRGTRLQPVSP